MMERFMRYVFCSVLLFILFVHVLRLMWMCEYVLEFVLVTTYEYLCPMKLKNIEYCWVELEREGRVNKDLGCCGIVIKVGMVYEFRLREENVVTHLNHTTCFSHFDKFI